MKNDLIAMIYNNARFIYGRAARVKNMDALQALRIFDDIREYYAIIRNFALENADDVRIYYAAQYMNAARAELYKYTISK